MIHIAYSEKHFFPGRPSDSRSWFTCSLTARNLWETVAADHPGTTYGDRPPDTRLGLLWTQRDDTLCRSRADRIAYIAAGAYPVWVNRVVARAARGTAGASTRAALRAGRELRPISDLWRHFVACEWADLILLKGNATIRETYVQAHPAWSAKIRVFDNGIMPERHPDRGGPREFATFVHPVTRFSLRKGSHLVAEAWPAIVAAHPGARLLLLGRSGDYDIAARLAGVAGVEMMGEYECGGERQIAALNRASWVLFPSLAEGQAGSLLEAMACGCVPLATRASGVDAEYYGGWPIAPADPAEVRAVALHTLDCRDPDALRTRCVAQVHSRHRWDRFAELARHETARLLAQPPVRKPPRSVLLPRFLLGMLRSRSHPR